MRTSLFTLIIALGFVSLSCAREWNVADAGAVGDASTDNTEVFQKVLDEAGKAGGGIVHVPTGRYRINGTLSIPSGVTLQGTFRVPPTNRHDRAPDFHGSVLLAYAGRGSREGEPFIRLAGNMSTVAGLIVHYPEWRQSDVPPVLYPPCVLGQNYDNMGIIDCCFINPYEAIRLDLAGRFLVRNVYGYPSFRGLYVDRCFDVGRVENCHFWPFGVHYKQEEPYCEWINLNGVAFEFARTDWQYVLNTFCFGYGVGYKFSESKSGVCNGQLLGIGADCCRRSVLVEQTWDAGLLFTNGEFVGRWGSTDSVGLEIAEKANGHVSLSNCTFFGPLDRCIWQRGRNSHLTVSGCQFVSWDIGAVGSAAVHLEGGKAIVQGNNFVAGKLPAYVGEKVQSAILIGNQASSGFRAENHAGDRTQLVGNEEDHVVWTEEAKVHYRVDIGSDGDDRYLRRWHQREPNVDWGAPDKSMRWSGADSEIVVPVLPGTAYTVTLDLNAPETAKSDDLGLHCGDERIIAFPTATNIALSGKLSPQESDSVTLQLRCKGWIPHEEDPKSNDMRTLGIAVRSITLKAESAGEKIFNANTGQWIE
jgi:hypothetical protein